MAVTDHMVKRINELAHKAKSEGLTDAEREEQQKLRAEYIAAFRASLRDTLEHTTIVEPDGSRRKVSRKPSNQ